MVLLFYCVILNFVPISCSISDYLHILPRHAQSSYSTSQSPRQDFLTIKNVKKPEYYGIQFIQNKRNNLLTVTE